MVTLYPAAVVGGGPAGLQAALTLGRMHIETLLFDDGRYRNSRLPGEPAVRMHNVLASDGIAPEEFRSRGRRELGAYPWVTTIEARVTDARIEGDLIVLATPGGDRGVSRLVIATGVEDALLPIEGLRELWGDAVLPCPYCHGHEFSAGPIAVISSGEHAEHVGGLLRGVADAVPVLEPRQVARVRRTVSGVAIDLLDGRLVEAASVFVPPNPVPRVTIAEALGVLVEAGGIAVDALGRTSRSGVWAAGDVVKRVDPGIPQSVVTAMSAGLTAAADLAGSVAAARDAGTGVTGGSGSPRRAR